MDAGHTDAPAPPAPGTPAYCRSIDVEGDGCVVVTKNTAADCYACMHPTSTQGMDTGASSIAISVALLLGYLVACVKMWAFD